MATDIRKFVYIKIWFSTPSNWKASLGDEFWVKKQWSITREKEPFMDSSIKDSKKQQYLTRFLNKLRFHYIPAIKDRRIFEHLLGQIYTVIASQQAFSESLKDFSTALRERTSELSSEILKGLGIDSNIAPPEDLTGLFHSLDFETNTEPGDSYSLTHQRGDGIQVRHIPAILAFLSDRGHEDYHLWGFEEPENSLELANAIEEAKAFSSYGNKANKQIFLTSHSPAFFSLANDKVARFFVSKSQQHGERYTSKLSAIKAEDPAGPGELMGELPHLTVISQYLQEAHKKIVNLRAKNDELAGMIKQRDKSLVFIEGESDRIIFDAAWEIFVGEQKNFEFEVCTGTTKMESLSREGKVINRLAPERKVLVIVDNDEAGRNLYNNGHLGDGARWIKHNSNGVHWCRLPFLGEFRKFMEQIKIPKAFWPGCLENLFSPELKAEALVAGKFKLSKTPYREFLDPERFAKVQPFLNENEIARFFILAPENESKIDFASWVAKTAVNTPEILEPLKGLILGLKQIIE